MPKDTFKNLSEEKKERIFDAAIEEFSARRFSEASINKIVKTAGIPRGSFYQYFSGKEDIYAYMATEIAREQMVVSGFIEPPAADAGAFDVLVYKARVAFELFRVRPKYRRIAQLMEKDDSVFIAELRYRLEQETNGIKELIERDKRLGLIKPDADASLAAGIAYALAKKEYLRPEQDSGAFLKRLNDMLGIIKEGIAADLSP